MIILILIIGCLLLLVFVIFGLLILSQVKEMVRLLKCSGSSRYTNHPSTPDGYTEIDTERIKRQIDEQDAVRQYRTSKQETVQSFTQNMGEEILIEDN